MTDDGLDLFVKLSHERGMLKLSRDISDNLAVIEPIAAIVKGRNENHYEYNSMSTAIDVIDNLDAVVFMDISNVSKLLRSILSKIEEAMKAIKQ